MCRCPHLVLRQAAQFCFSAGLAAPFLRRPATMLSGANTPPNTPEISRKKRIQESMQRKLIKPQSLSSKSLGKLNDRTKCSVKIFTKKQTVSVGNGLPPFSPTFWAPNLADSATKIPTKNLVTWLQRYEYGWPIMEFTLECWGIPSYPVIGKLILIRKCFWNAQEPNSSWKFHPPPSVFLTA